MRRNLLKIVILAATIFQGLTAFAQDNWQHVGFGGDIYGVKMVSPTVGYAGGGTMIFKSTDGGNTWSTDLTITIDITTNSLYFFDANTLWAFGGSKLQKTTDAGQHWITKLDAANCLFNKFYFYDANIGFAFGTNSITTGGIIYKTIDGGETWASIFLGTTYPVGAIQFSDPNTGWSLNATEMDKTTDGGATWTRVYSAVSNNLYAFKFLDNNKGFISGSGGFLLGTTDGGVSWNPINTGVPNELEAIVFTDANTGWICGRGGIMIKTTNGGANWTTQQSNTFEDFYSITAVDANTVIASGRDAQIFKTADGGTTWASVSPAIRTTQSNIFAAFFTDEKNGWLASGGGVIVHTKDGAQTWTRHDPLNNTAGLRDVYFLNSQEGWVCGQNGVLFHTADAGLNWNLIPTGSSIYLDKVYFFDSNNGWLFQSGLIYHTTDGGLSWSTTPMAVKLYAVAFTDANHGKAIGSDAFVYTTTDGGASWTTSGTGINASFISYAYLQDANTGYAVNQTYNKIFMTTNGGLSWNILHSSVPFSDAVNTVFFKDNSNGWVAGYNGYLAKTTDAGGTWTTQVLNTNTFFSYITGKNGVVYLTGNGGNVYKNNFAAAALPVTLLNFSAVVKNNYPELSWASNNEINFKEFEIQRSINGKDFNSIGNRTGLAGNTLQDYTFTDWYSNLAPSATLYYRLKLIDKDGAFSYSKVLSVQLSQEQLMNARVNPNPINDKATVTLNCLQQGKLTLQIEDMNGQLIRVRELEVAKGPRTVEWNNLNGLAQGAYILHIQLGTTFSFVKIIKH